MKTQVLPSGKYLCFDIANHTYTVFNTNISLAAPHANAKGTYSSAHKANKNSKPDDSHLHLSSDSPIKKSNNTNKGGNKKSSNYDLFSSKNNESVVDAVGVRCSSVSSVLDGCFPFDSLGVASRVSAKSPSDIIVFEDEVAAGMFDGLEVEAMYKEAMRRRQQQQQQKGEESTAADISSILMGDERDDASALSMSSERRERREAEESRDGVTSVKSIAEQIQITSPQPIPNSNSSGGNPTAPNTANNTNNTTSALPSADRFPLLDLDGRIMRRRPTPQEVIAGWSRRAALGSNVHAFIEQKIAGEPLSPRVDCQGEEHLYYPVADAAAAAVLEEYDPVAIELMVASSDLRLAGTIDFLGRSKKTGGLLVGDWKTSSSQFSEYRFHSFDEPCPDPNKLPFLVNEKHRRYCLQVLIYGYLLRREGYLKEFGQPMTMMMEEAEGVVGGSKAIRGEGGGGLLEKSKYSKTKSERCLKRSNQTKKNKAEEKSTLFVSQEKSGISSSETAERNLAVNYLPLEYGIIQMSKNIDGTAGVMFKKVTPLDIVPVDMAGDDVTADDVIRSLIGF